MSKIKFFYIYWLIWLKVAINRTIIILIRTKFAKSHLKKIALISFLNTRKNEKLKEENLVGVGVNSFLRLRLRLESSNSGDSNSVTLLRTHGSQWQLLSLVIINNVINIYKAEVHFIFHIYYLITQSQLFFVQYFIIKIYTFMGNYITNMILRHLSMIFKYSIWILWL